VRKRSTRKGVARFAAGLSTEGEGEEERGSGIESSANVALLALCPSSIPRLLASTVDALGGCLDPDPGWLPLAEVSKPGGGVGREATPWTRRKKRTNSWEHLILAGYRRWTIQTWKMQLGAVELEL
jgi:hypothetical protein